MEAHGGRRREGRFRVRGKKTNPNRDQIRRFPTNLDEVSIGEKIEGIQGIISPLPI
jgi:hypothetical protein